MLSACALMLVFAGTPILYPLQPSAVFPDGDLGVANQSAAALDENRTLFFGSTSASGLEPWVTDGTQSGTHLLRDTARGTPSSNSSYEFTVIGTSAYFATDDEVWVTDGSLRGTHRLTRTRWRSPTLLSANGQLVMSSFDGNTTSLWRAEGSAPATFLLNLRPTPTYVSVARLFESAGVAYFSTLDGVGYEVWRTDGTAAGTTIVQALPEPGEVYLLSRSPDVMVTVPSGGGALRRLQSGGPGVVIGTTPMLRVLGQLGDSLLVIAYSTRAVSRVTASSVQGVKTLPLVSGCSPSFSPAVEHLGNLYFSYCGELWRSDGTAANTVPLSLTVGGATVSGPTPVLSWHNQLVIQTATHRWVLFDGAQTIEPARADGQPTVFTTPTNAVPFYPIVAGQKLLLPVCDPRQGCEPWALKPGGALLSPVGNFNQARLGARPTVIGAEGNHLWLTSERSFGTELLVFERTADGGSASSKAGPSPDGGGHSVAVREGLGLNGHMFFGGSLEPSIGDELLIATPQRVITIDLQPGPASSTPAELTAFDGGALFSASNFDVGRELFRTTGHDAELVADVRPGSLSSHPSELVASPNGVFFVADDGTHGAEVWLTDGTERGTHLVVDLLPGPRSSYPRQLVVSGAHLFFVANDGVAGDELYVSDGTASGTRLVADLRAGPRGSAADSLTAVGQALFFLADDGVMGRELWVIRSAASAPLRVLDANLGPGNGSYGELRALGERLLFTATTQAEGTELWRSDGTLEGTTCFDLMAGPDSSLPSNLRAFGTIAVFSALDPEFGLELWRSDGTGVGTQRLTDIAPMSLSSFPGPATQVGKTLYFAATDASGARELFGLEFSELIDNTPPSISLQVTPQTDAGTQVTPVEVSWFVEDLDSLVTQVTGCDAQRFESDTPHRTLICSASSEGGLAAASHALEVDLSAPVLSCPQTIEREASQAVSVDFTPSATDAVDPSPRVVALPASGSRFELGTTSVQVTASDASGHQSTCVFDVRVTMPPEPEPTFPSPIKPRGCSSAPGDVSLLLLTAAALLGRRRAWLLLVLLMGCQFDQTVPLDTFVRCQSDSECPGALSCDATLSRCVSTRRPFVTTPTFAPERGRAGTRFTTHFELTAKPKRLPVVRGIGIGGAETPRWLVTADDLTHYTASWAPLGDEAEGLTRIVADVTLSDGEQFHSVTLGSATLDFTPPRALEASLRFEALPDNTLATVGLPDLLRALGPRSRAVVNMVVDEPLSVAPAVSARADQSTLAFTLTQTDGLQSRHEYQAPPPGTPTGPWRLEAVVRDLVGNEATLELQTSTTLRCLLEAPRPPDVDTANRVVYTRSPAGALFDQVPQFSVSAEPAALDGPGALLVIDGPFIIARAPVLDDGSVTAFSLGLEADVPTVAVRAVDSAGNVSAKVTIRTIEWSGNGASIPTQAFAHIWRNQTTHPLGITTSGTLAFDGGGIALEGVPAFITDNEVFGGEPISAASMLCSPGPAYIEGEAVATNARTGEQLMFGGRDRWGTYIGFSQRIAPPLRSNAAAAIERTPNSRVVLFGGSFDGGLLGDTWLLEGAWRELSSGAAPSPRSDATMAEDAARGRLILVGGLTHEGVVGDTWAFADGGWSPLSTSVSPRSKAKAVFDARRNRVVLIGGFNGAGSELSDVFELVDDQWQPVDARLPPGGPSAACWAAGDGLVVAPFTTDAGTAIFGYDGTRWFAVKKPPAPGPVNRAGSAFAWSPLRRELILCGGSDWLDDCGEYDCSWVYDARNAVDQTWAWNGAWRLLDAGTSAGARAGALIAADPTSGVLLMAGGSPSSGFMTLGLDDQWAPVVFDGGPSPSALAAMGSAPHLGGIAAIEKDALHSTWLLHDGVWSRTSPAPEAPTSNLVFDSALRGLVFASDKGLMLWQTQFTELPSPLLDRYYAGSLSSDTKRQRLLAAQNFITVRGSAWSPPLAVTPEIFMYDEARDVFVGSGRPSVNGVESTSLLSPRAGQPGVVVSITLPPDATASVEWQWAQVTVVGGADSWRGSSPVTGIEILPHFERRFGVWGTRFTNDAGTAAPVATTARIEGEVFRRELEPSSRAWSALVVPTGTNGENDAHLRATALEVRVRFHRPKE